MKKLFVFVLVTGLVLPAFSIKVDFKAHFRTRAAYVLNKDLNKDTAADLAIIDSRLRLWIIPQIDTDLKLVYGIEVGDVSWGEEVGSFVLDNDLGKGSGGAEASDGVNVETKHLYADYRFSEAAGFKLGLLPFATPCKFVVDSDMPALLLDWQLAGLQFTLLYARAYAGPRGKDIATTTEDTQQAPKDADTLNLGDDRNDYFLSVAYSMGKPLTLNAWFLFDDNNRFKQDAPGIPVSSDLFFLGIQAQGKVQKFLRYSADFVYNFGSVTQTGAGSETVSAFAAALRGRIDLAPFNVGFNMRLLSGNSASQTNAGDTVQQFHVLDGDDGDARSWLSLLFGGGAFNHQSYFHHKTATARRLNVTRGYFVRNDPGITAFEFFLEKRLFEEKLRARLIFGFASTTQAVALDDGSEANFLGSEVDIALRYKLNRGTYIYLQFATLFPGKALGKTLSLDNARYPRPTFGTDPAFKLESQFRVRF